MTNPNHHEHLSPPASYEEVLYSMYTLIDLDKLREFDSLSSAQDVVRDPNFYEEDGVVVTPLVPSFSRWEHLDQYTKLETNQGIGAFKARGAQAGGETIMYNYPSTRYVCAYSAGNHGLGVAQFVKTWNQRLIRQGEVAVDDDGRILARDKHKLLEAHIFVASRASPDKIALLQAFAEFGTVLHVGGASLDEAGRRCDAFINDKNAGKATAYTIAQLLHPYKNPDVMAGQSTALLETVFQLRDNGADLAAKPLLWYVGYGGGGLANGSAVLMDCLVRLGVVHPGSKVIAAQMENCDSTIRALDRLDRGNTNLKDLFIDPDTKRDTFDPSADGTAVRDPDPGNVGLTRYLRQQGVLELRRVSKKSVAHAMQLLDAKREPAGALGKAAAQDDENRRAAHWVGNGGELQAQEAAIVVTVASGGNRSDQTVLHFEKNAGSRRNGIAVALGGATVRGTPEAPRRRQSRAAGRAGATALALGKRRGPF